MSHQTGTRTRRRPLRTLFKFVLLLVMLSGGLVALLPTLINAGLGQGMMVAAIEEQVQGSVEIQSMRLAWFDSQQIEGFIITDGGGTEAANLDLEVKHGLFALLRGVEETIEASLSGSLRGELRADGSLSFADLFRSQSSSSPSGSSSLSTGKTADSLPALAVEVDDLRINLRDEVMDRDYRVKGLRGEARFEPGGELSVYLESAVSCGDTRGSISLDATLRGLIDKTGNFAPAGAGVDFLLEIEGLPIPLDEANRQIAEMAVAAKTDDLTSTIELSLEVEVEHAEGLSSAVNAHFLATTLFDRRGEFTGELSGITGSAEGENVPVSLLQPFLAGTGIDAVRDLGDTINIVASINAPPGKKPDDNSGHQLGLEVRGEQLTLVFNGSVDETGKMLRGDLLKLEQVVQPGLVGEFAPISLSGPARVEMVLRGFTLPLTGESGSYSLDGVGGVLTARLLNPVAVSWNEEEPAVQIDSWELTLGAETLGQGIMVTGGAVLDGGTLRLEGTVSDLLDAQGQIDLQNLRPRGTLEVKDYPAAAVLARMKDSPVILEEALGGPINATLMMEETTNLPRIELLLNTSGAELAVEARWGKDQIEVDEVRVEVEMGRGQFARIAESLELPQRLSEAATATVSVTPFTIHRSRPGESFALPPSLAARIDIERIGLDNAAPFVEPVRVEGFNLEVEAWLGDHPKYRVQGDGYLQRAGTGERIAQMAIEMEAQTLGDDLLPSGRVELRDLRMQPLEQALGQEEGALVELVGNAGNISMEIEGSPVVHRALVSVDLPRLSGKYSVALGDETLGITDATTVFTLTPRVMDKWMGGTESGLGKGGDGGTEGVRSAGGGTGGWRLEREVPVTVQIRRCDLPLALLRGEEFDPAAVALDLQWSGEALALRDPQNSAITLHDLAGSVSLDDLSKGVRFQAGGRRIGGGEGITGGTGESGISTSAGAEGRLEILGSITNLIDESSRLHPEGATLHLNATIDALPTALVDAAADLGGMLEHAVGNTMSAAIQADDFSDHSGTLNADITSPHGWLKLAARGGEGLVHLEGESPLTAELEITPELRERMLKSIHPMLADIRTTEQPLRVVVSSAEVPVNGDLSRLNAELTLTAGKVEFDSGSTILGVLEMFQTGKETIPGEIEPVVVHIREGVVTYDRFAVHIGAYTMISEGWVDLVKGTVNLDMDVPLAGLGHTFKELQGKVEGVMIPAHTRGTIDNNKTTVDVESVLGQIAEQEIGKALEDALGEDGKVIGDLLEGLFGGKKKKKP